MRKKAENYLPLTHSSFYILLVLGEPLHGYGIMQRVEEMSNGEVKLGPGTLYGALSKLEKEGLIVKIDGQENEQERRKSYILTDLGKVVVTLEYKRLQSLVEKCESFINNLGTLSEKP
ncbi:PadR family transcriptional regulator [Peribacillus sp. B-H-3]|uniref:PadR family transcriptional regulator n=1 Tax=Peribacillus sp. B-H-3 TaxID=3400420 RepID=UPI003B0196E4